MPKELKIENVNNKLACPGFVYIQLAPPLAGFDKQGNFVVPIREESFEQIFVVKTDGQDLLVKMESFIRLKFWQICSVYTIPGYGLSSIEFKKDFKEKYPATTDETDMAVYCFLRAE